MVELSVKKASELVGVETKDRQDIKKELRAKGRKKVTICGLTGVTSFWDTLINEEEGEKGWDVDYNVEDIRVAYEAGSKLPRTFCISVRRR